MNSLEIERRWQQELASRALGQFPGLPRQLSGEMRGFGLENDLIALPAELVPPMQDPDGHFLFMADFDGVDGPSIIL